MPTTPPARQRIEDAPATRSAEVEAFLSQLTDAQTRFVRAASDAGTWLDHESIELAECAALQARLTQQLFDAQRAILRQRADVESTANRLARAAEHDAQALVKAALADAAEVCSDLEAVTAFGDVLAMRKGRPGPPVPAEEPVAHEGSAAAAAEHQLQRLLDEWWRLEVDQGRAKLEDANGRAAVCLHLAEIEAGEIREAARAVSEAGETLAAEAGVVEPAALGVTDLVEPFGSSEVSTSGGAVEPPLPIAPPPWVLTFGQALDATDPAGLDALLASFLDALRDPPADVESSEAHANEASNAEVDRGGSTAISPDAHATASQDAFDRFWGSGHGRHAHHGMRDWVFVQILLPMVAVVAALALVLAWIG